LQPFLHRLATTPLYESYHTTHHYSTSSSTRDDARVVVLSPYAGTEELTEGLDWEAQQGRKAFEAVVGSGENALEFFEKSEDDVEVDADEV
jgi:hypothetical protein